jgi:hypothetical protein
MHYSHRNRPYPKSRYRLKSRSIVSEMLPMAVRSPSTTDCTSNHWNSGELKTIGSSKQANAWLETLHKIPIIHFLAWDLSSGVLPFNIPVLLLLDISPPCIEYSCLGCYKDIQRWDQVGRQCCNAQQQTFVQVAKARHCSTAAAEPTSEFNERQWENDLADNSGPMEPARNYLDEHFFPSAWSPGDTAAWGAPAIAPLAGSLRARTPTFMTPVWDLMALMFLPHGIESGW